MEQWETIEMLLEHSRHQENKEDRVQKAYEQYISGDDSAIDELLAAVEVSARQWVQWKLGQAGQGISDLDDVLQEARIGVWNLAQKHREQGVVLKTFVRQAFTVYKYKTYDALRGMSKSKGDISIDEPVGDSETPRGNIIPIIEYDYVEDDLKRTVYRELFLVYCGTLFSSDKFPPNCLSLYYARILPHMLLGIKDSKGASAKWAFQRMNGKSVWALKEESEWALRYTVDAKLRWGEKFLAQLETETTVENWNGFLKDLILTEYYDKNIIEDWAESMHKAVSKAASKIITSNPKLLSLVKEYISQENAIYKQLLKGGTAR